MVFTAALTPISQPWSATLGGTDGTLTSSLDKNRPGGGRAGGLSSHVWYRELSSHAWERELSSLVGEGALFTCGRGSSLLMWGRELSSHVG